MPDETEGAHAARHNPQASASGSAGGLGSPMLDTTKRPNLKPYYEDTKSGIVIYHGDCRDVLPHLPKVDLVLTDPSYGETSLPWDRWVPGWPNLICDKTNSLWCFGSLRMFLANRDDFARWTLAQDLVWEKPNGAGMAADRFRKVHELIVHFYRGPWSLVRHECPKLDCDDFGRRKGPHIRRRKVRPTHYGEVAENRGYTYDGRRIQRSVILAANRSGTALHPTEKPIGVVRPIIRYSTTENDAILDPFMGSGTTLRAAKDLGRKAIGIEIEERYCEIAARRLAQEVLAL